MFTKIIMTIWPVL